jgi:hypothetical protein
MLRSIGQREKEPAALLLATQYGPLATTTVTLAKKVREEVHEDKI